MSYSKVTFAKDHNEEFYKVLRKRVSEYFKTKNISRHANVSMVIKTFVMLLIYISPLVLLLTVSMPIGFVLLMWVIMGFGMAGIGLSVAWATTRAIVPIAFESVPSLATASLVPSRAPPA